MRTKNKRKPFVRPLNPQPVRITYVNSWAGSVCIAGTFNDWRPAATPMICLSEGWWIKDLVLPPGRYEYRLVVDGKWICDPAAREQTPNSHGDFNSILTVGASHDTGDEKIEAPADQRGTMPGCIAGKCVSKPRHKVV
jgi:1,4-alpha-glucan branching enzyme